MIIKRKGQAAMEFLMTYGWALLVVLIAIAALAFFGLLNPSRFLPERCELAPGLTCMDFNAKTNDTDLSEGDVNEDIITVILNNGIGKTMTDVYIEVAECTNNRTNSPSTSESVGNSSVISTLVAGDTKRINISCAGMVPDTRFRSDMTIKYTTSVEGVTNSRMNQSKTGYLVVQVDGQ